MASPGRNGLIRRTLVTPANPRTPAQLAVRDILQPQARRFDALTQAQQDAWIILQQAAKAWSRDG